MLPKEPSPAPTAKTRKTVKTSKQIQLKTDDMGLMKIASLKEQMAYAQTLMAAGVISTTFKTPQQVVIAIQYALAIDIPIIPALKMMYVVNGQPCLYGDGPLMMCQKTGLVEGFREFFLNIKGDEICFKSKNLKDEVWGCVTRIKRKGDSEWQEDYFTKDDLKRAKIDQRPASKGGGKKVVWALWERNMMRYKPRSMALKSKFADRLHGVGIAEYDHHFSPETPEIPSSRKTEKEPNETQTQLGNL